MKDEKTMSTPEVAAALGVSDQTVRRWAESGELKPANKRNPLLKKQAYRFLRSDVEEKLAPRE